MKNLFFILRVNKEEKEELRKAAVGHRSIAAFLLSAVKQAKKYRRLIEQAKKLENKGYKVSAMKVEVL